MALATNEKWNYGIALGVMGAIVGMAIFSRKPKKDLTLREIGKLDDKVRDFHNALSSWNLKYDSFPDIDEWLDKNWNAPYGRENARGYLLDAMARRSNSFFGIHTGRKDWENSEGAYKGYRAALSDLKGDAYKFKKLALKEERALGESGLRLRKMEKPAVSAPVRLYTMKQSDVPKYSGEEYFDWDKQTTSQVLDDLARRYGSSDD